MAPRWPSLNRAITVLKGDDHFRIGDYTSNDEGLF